MLATLADVKLALGVTGTADDPRLGLLAGAADRWVKNYCGREFESARATEYYSGTGNRVLVLRRRPVTLVHGVLEKRDGNFGETAAVDGGFDAATDTLTAGVQYALWRATTTTAPAGLLVRLGTNWPLVTSANRVGLVSQEGGPLYGNVRVDYTAGYAPLAVPEDLKVAVAMVAAHWARAAPYGGAAPQKEELGRWSYELAAADLSGRYGLPAGVTGILAAYREVTT